MNAYAVAPLVAVIAYIPLLLTTISSRPWQRRNILFTVFLLAALSWSLIDFFYRGNFFPEHNNILFRLVVISFSVMVVQFHHFTTSFYPPRKNKWLIFAYLTLIPTITLTALGYVTSDVATSGNLVSGKYLIGVIFVAIPIVTLAARNFYVFGKMLKNQTNPVLHNQVLALILGISALTITTALSIPSWGDAFPIPHYGNLINAFILSYAVIRHQLVDIKLILKRGTVLVAIMFVGLAIYWLLLIIAQKIFNFELDVYASIAASVLAVGLSLLIYFVRDRFVIMVSRAFQGSNYQSQQELHNFTSKIHNVFSLKEQGGELLSLLVKALNIKQACLLFPEADTGDLHAQFYEPQGNNLLVNFRLRSNNPIIKYLEKEKKFLTKENLAILPSFLSLWPQEREEIESKNITMFIPLISRERLIAILVLGEKKSGRFSLENLSMIENVTSRVAVSMEKEYLREQLREREEELSVINNSSMILASSLDIQEIFGSFVEELKKVVDVTWASIVLIDEDEFVCVALSAPESSAYQIGDRVPMERTGTAWVVSQKKPFIEPDLAVEKYFTTSEFFYEHGLRSTAYLPLIAKGKIIGSFILCSKTPHAFVQRHVRLLEQLASQIAMPLENSQLYARAEKKARVDELTGLYNRRSLDEMIDSEISRHSRYGGTFSLAILDLDSFKAYNDTYGHLAGDDLLKIIGNNIKSALRTSDYAFRYGGDEFAVLLPQTTVDAALSVLERVREKIGVDIDPDKINITASIGVASWPDDGISHTDIIASADVTLYRAKRSGGNQTLCASGSLPGIALQDIGEMSEVDFKTKLTSIIGAFSEMVDSRSYYTNKHSKKVTGYALALAKALGFNNEETIRVENCGLLHDIGKLCISNDIIGKSGEFTKEERAIFNTHPQLAVDMIKNIPQLADCVEPILHHHERFDGTGYPNGQKGEDIPIISRILTIANKFANMTSERSYSETVTHEIALEEIKSLAGKDFDPYLVEKFISIFEKKTDDDSEKARKESGSGPSSAT
jgi:diguanylate cyclase (GGDEF)-like protein/putative nucleotidyltransferase with HDIG domain